MPVIGDHAGIALENVLFATDFSDVSNTAADLAEEVCRHFSSRLTVLHVKNDQPRSTVPAYLSGVDETHVGVITQELMDDLRIKFSVAGVRVQTEVLPRRSAVEGILAEVARIRPQMVILGTHSPAGLRRVLIGSVAEGVIRAVKCPVLTVNRSYARSSDKGLSFQNVVFATDLGSGSLQKASVAMAFAHESRGKVHLCHVLQHPGRETAQISGVERETLDRLTAMVPGYAKEFCSPESVVEYGSTPEQVLKLCERVQADLLVVGASAAPEWLTHISGGTLGALLSGALCPVLTLISNATILV